MIILVFRVLANASVRVLVDGVGVEQEGRADSRVLMVWRKKGVVIICRGRRRGKGSVNGMGWMMLLND